MTQDLAVSISAHDELSQYKAHALSVELNLKLEALNHQKIQLVVSSEKVEIRSPELGNPIFIDFEAGKNAHRRQFGGGRGQPLAKAIGLKKGATPSIIDATAGFGRDALVLANLGCTITLIERQPLIATLLEDGLQRAKSNNDITGIIAHMQLVKADAYTYLSGLTEALWPDVVYMDPMYPSREKSALVKKDMRLLHQLSGPDLDSEQLLTIAKQRAKKRVVVKRPKSAPWVGNQKPSTHTESKNTRYDIYVTL
jgi:16S rRNA (guanine1516-N2)-methyltransferase